MSDFEFPEKYTVFWPGQTIHVCSIHHVGIINLAVAMGMPIPDMREEEGHECKNCVTEARVIRGKSND